MLQSLLMEYHASYAAQRLEIFYELITVLSKCI